MFVYCGVTSQTLDIFVFSLAMLHDEDCENRLDIISTLNGIVGNDVS